MCCIVFVTSGCWFLSKLQSTKGLATKIHTHNIPTFYQDNVQILELLVSLKIAIYKRVSYQNSYT